jgi:hypothetical protein
MLARMSEPSKIHPALALFTRLFHEAASPDNVYTPEMFVNRWVFVDRCKAAGIAVPTNPVRVWEWEESIGLNAHVRKLVRAYHRSRGTKPGPASKFWKIRRTHRPSQALA